MHLNLAVSSLKTAALSTERLEAFCFAVMIKSKWVNSELYYNSINALRTDFKISYERARRVLGNAIEYGYVEEKDGRIKAKPLKELNKRNVTFLKDSKASIKITIKNIRKLIAKYKIAAVAEISNNQEKTKSSMNYKEVQRLRKLNKRYGINKQSGTISMRRFAKDMACSIGTAKKIIKEMIRNGEIKSYAYKPELIMKGANRTAYMAAQTIYGACFFYNGCIYSCKSNMYDITNFDFNVKTIVEKNGSIKNIHNAGLTPKEVIQKVTANQKKLYVFSY